MNNLAVSVCEQIIAALPDLLKKALIDYEKLLALGMREKTKAHYDACKAALAHIALFVKVAEELTGSAAPVANRHAMLESLLQDARKELSDQ